MGTSRHRLHIVERGQFGQDDLQQSRTIEVVETRARMRRKDDFVEFVLNALATDDFQAVGIATEGLESLVLDEKAELRGEANAAQHSQWVVAEGDVGIERCADNAVLEVVEAVERIDQFAETPFVQANRHRIDGEIATILVVFECTVFDNRFSRVTLVTFAASTHEFHFKSPRFHLRCPKVFENTQMRLFAEFFLQLLGHANPTSDHHHIDVFRRSFKENVAHITAHDITFHTEFVGAVANQVKNRLIEQFGKFFVTIKSHR